MATLGEAYVEVHADTRPFARELRREIQSILDKTDAKLAIEAQKTGVSIAKGIGKGMDKETTRATTTFHKRLVTRLKGIGNDAVDEFNKSFRRLATSNFILFRVIGGMAERFVSLAKVIRKVGGEVWNFTRRLSDAAAAVLVLSVEGLKAFLGFGNQVEQAVGEAGKAAVSLGSAIASLAASAASGAVGIAAMAAAVALLAAVLGLLISVIVVGLAPFADLIGFATVLPAALASIVAVVLPLIVAMHNLGDAMKLVFEKDPEKLKKGLLKLSPVLRSLVADLRTAVPVFNRIQDATQKAFYGPIVKQLLPTIRKIGPILEKGFAKVGAAAGAFVADILTLLQNPTFTTFLNDLFPRVAQMISTISGPMIRLISALTNAADNMLPSLEMLGGLLSGWIDDFATWINESVKDGSFQQFLTDAIASLQSIWNLTTSLIGLFGAMFAQTDEGGRNFLDTLTAAINKFTDWVNSPDGRRAMADMVIAAVMFAHALDIALTIARKIWSVMSGAFHLAVLTLQTLGIINSSGVSHTSTSLASTNLNSYSGGGVPGYDQIALVHKGEAILDPANSPAKNQAIMKNAGMLDMVEQPQVFNIYIGGEKFAEYVDYRIGRASETKARSIQFASPSRSN